jgi:hypothetical protein
MRLHHQQRPALDQNRKGSRSVQSRPLRLRLNQHRPFRKQTPLTLDPPVAMAPRHGNSKARTRPSPNSTVTQIPTVGARHAVPEPRCLALSSPFIAIRPLAASSALYHWPPAGVFDSTPVAQASACAFLPRHAAYTSSRTTSHRMNAEVQRLSNATTRFNREGIST